MGYVNHHVVSSRRRDSMVVADGPVSVWCQAIYNHHDGEGLSERLRNVQI